MFEENNLSNQLKQEFTSAVIFPDPFGNAIIPNFLATFSNPCPLLTAICTLGS